MSWIEETPKNIDVDIIKPHTKYITIPKSQFEKCLPDVVDTLRAKLDTDVHGVSIYEHVSNVYLGVLHNKNVVIYQGHGSHPMYDSDSLQIEQYFIDKTKFDTLCIGLDVSDCSQPVHTYILVDPIIEATKANNLIYSDILRLAKSIDCRE